MRKAQRVLLLRVAYTLTFTTALIYRFPKEALEWLVYGSGGVIFVSGMAHAVCSVYLRLSKRVSAIYRGRQWV